MGTQIALSRLIDTVAERCRIPNGDNSNRHQRRRNHNETLVCNRRRLFVIALTVFGCVHQTSGTDSGWVTLLDGSASSLNNWNRVGDANWRSEDGLIVADKGKGGFFVSKNSYKDYQIRAEFWADHTTNSGFFMRVSDPQKVAAASSYEVNIYDSAPSRFMERGRSSTSPRCRRCQRRAASGTRI
jgi:hypothetical protein